MPVKQVERAAHVSVAKPAQQTTGAGRNPPDRAADATFSRSAQRIAEESKKTHTVNNPTPPTTTTNQDAVNYHRALGELHRRQESLSGVESSAHYDPRSAAPDGSSVSKSPLVADADKEVSDAQSHVNAVEAQALSDRRQDFANVGNSETGSPIFSSQADQAKKSAEILDRISDPAAKADYAVSIGQNEIRPTSELAMGYAADATHGWSAINSPLSSTDQRASSRQLLAQLTAGELNTSSAIGQYRPGDQAQISAAKSAIAKTRLDGGAGSTPDTDLEAQFSMHAGLREWMGDPQEQIDADLRKGPA